MGIFKTNVNDHHKYLFRPKCRPPTIVSESKENKKFFSIIRDKIYFEIIFWRKKIVLKMSICDSGRFSQKVPLNVTSKKVHEGDLPRSLLWATVGTQESNIA